MKSSADKVRFGLLIRITLQQELFFIKIVLISFLKGVAKIVNRIRNMKCPKCEKETRQYKIGKTKAGSPEISLLLLGGSYTPEKKHPGYSAEVRQKAIRFYVDGMGLRRTARQLGNSSSKRCKLGKRT